MSERPMRPEELEDVLNRRLYHPLAWQLARLLAHTPVTPNMVSVVGGLCVVAAGLAYTSLAWPLGALLGLGLHMAWHVVDGADGDLARMSGRSSPRGEMIDGMCDYLSHAVLYLMLGRMFAEQVGTIGWLVMLAAALVHAVQSNHVESQRRFYQSWVYGKAWLIETGPPAAPGGSPISRLGRMLTALYLRVATGLSATAVTLDARVREVSGDPARLEQVRSVIRARWQPLLRLELALGPNPRAILLGLAMLIGRSPGWYFTAILVSGLAMLWSVRAHERGARDVLARIG